MVKRQKLTMFLDAKETTPVAEVKKMLEGITKKAPEDQKLFFKDTPLDDTKTIGDCGLTSAEAKAQSPALLGLAFRLEGK